MHAPFRARLTYANVMATLALFIALGGSGYAAITLPTNSVGVQQLKRNAVNGLKVKDNSLTGADINEATLSLPAAPGTSVTYKTATATAPASSAANTATAACDASQKLIGGGVKLDPPGIGVVNDSFPDANNTAWTARIGNATNGNTARPLSFTVYALCSG